MSKSENQRGGIGFLSAFFLVLFVLKVTGSLGWSWWWVVAPIWGPWAAVAGIFVFGGVLWIIATIGEAIFETPARKKKRMRKKLLARARKTPGSVGTTGGKR